MFDHVKIHRLLVMWCSSEWAATVLKVGKRPLVAVAMACLELDSGLILNLNNFINLQNKTIN